MLMDTEKDYAALEAEAEMDLERGGDAPAPAEDEDEDSLILTFARPYKFEGQAHTEVDLSGLEDTSATDLMAVNKILSRKGTVSAMPEMSLDFAIYMAARVTKMPVEFFMGLPSRETVKLKNIVVGFLYGGDGED